MTVGHAGGAAHAGLDPGHLQTRNVDRACKLLEFNGSSLRAHGPIVAPRQGPRRAFGIVTTGFNIGGTIGPILAGWIMDLHAPRWVFYNSVVFMGLTVVPA
ncbi:MAG TPA: MFS transporter [Acetobacteraceae bacterium]|nr:MFS transporter [Acetobacteraceae bacterium]